MATNTVITTGDFVATFAHPLVVGGAQIPLKGIVLNGTFLTTRQDTKNSRRVLLANGDTLPLTNALKSGTLTLNVVRVSSNVMDGDVIAIANVLQGAVDNIGGTLSISFGLNGKTITSMFFDVRLAECPPVEMSGNDLANYPVSFTYGTFIQY